jgi:hypothetical protein
MSEGILPRSAQIRRGDYVVVEGSRGLRRDFRITVGLREGWDEDGRVYDISEAVRTARAWMRRRVEAGMPALSGMFTRAEVTYAWPRPDGSAGSGRDPVAVFTGEAVHAYLGHLPDKEIEAMLNELTAKAVAELCGLYLTDARSRIKTSTFSIDRSRIESHVKPLIGRHAVAAHLRKSGPRRPAPCRHQAAPLSVA